MCFFIPSVYEYMQAMRFFSFLIVFVLQIVFMRVHFCCFAIPAAEISRFPTPKWRIDPPDPEE